MKNKIEVKDLTISELIDYKKVTDMLHQYYDNLANINRGSNEQDEFQINKRNVIKYNSIRGRIINEMENRISGIVWEK